MQLNTLTPALFAISSLIALGSSLPFPPRNDVWLEPLVRRATYSVVPVDGGPAAATSGNGQVGATIIETVTETPAPATKTIVETDNLPATTDYIISMKTVQGPETVQTAVVTLTPSPATVTTTGYSIIDVNSPPVTVVIPAPAPSSSSSSTVVSTTSSSSSIETSSSSSVEVPSSVLVTASSLSTTSSTTSSISVSTSTSASYFATVVTSISVSASITSSSTTFDNGQWHTYYPLWSNTTSTSASSQPVQTTSSVAALPTLQASAPVKVPTDSIPFAESGNFGSLGKRSGPDDSRTPYNTGHFGRIG